MGKGLKIVRNIGFLMVKRKEGFGDEIKEKSKVPGCCSRVANGNQ